MRSGACAAATPFAFAPLDPGGVKSVGCEHDLLELRRGENAVFELTRRERGEQPLLRSARNPA